LRNWGSSPLNAFSKLQCSSSATVRVCRGPVASCWLLVLCPDTLCPWCVLVRVGCGFLISTSTWRSSSEVTKSVRICKDK
jgi:hypothetical protein